MVSYGTLEASLGSGNSEKFWLKQAVNEETRLKLNAEFVEHMEYARAVKANGGVSLKKDKLGNPQSCDASMAREWTYEERPFIDAYVLITTVIWMLPKLIVYLPTMCMLTFIPCFLCRVFMGIMPESIDRVQRNYIFYMTSVIICCTLFLPAILLATTSYVLDLLVFYLFSIPFCIVTLQWGQVFKNFEVIRPLKGGLSILAHSTDIMMCIMGQSVPQGLFEITYMVSRMFVLLPWLKYYINCNPYIYVLDHRLVQQISTSMEDFAPLTKHYCFGFKEGFCRRKDSDSSWLLAPDQTLEEASLAGEEGNPGIYL
mmetsp:Transcript_68660/g.107380  ORF Transcript_68660/g.107380 Transcript_68660/m.107380 type:complete len:314 (+) Transcript_68660:52-993(+)|eukprot:CAMPEP_0169132056 /NCGR_PEP_ID=MMETSP1015-20121227/38586_1 /TAXON_ID=342587 /ORGANISM="Karlodinium micrum, Strain CCMP2283" /LENGTH=313 /DNA_ID=CAMNT_0009196377 /DNA_START=54 /DNA_END=995 /DNA_ORIENTATION=+